MFNYCYLNNAWNFLYAILHESVVIHPCTRSFVLYTLQWIVELPAILDSFIPIPQVIYMGWLVGAGGGPWSGGLNNVSCIYTPTGPNRASLLLQMSQKVAKSLHNTASKPCGDLQPCTASSMVWRAHYRQPGHSWMCDTAHNQPQQKQTEQLLALVHTWIVSGLMWLLNGDKRWISKWCVQDLFWQVWSQFVCTYYNF